MFTIGIASIFGANVGIEFVTPELADLHDANWGLIIDLLFIRILLLRTRPEE